MSDYTPTTDIVRRDYAYVLFFFGPTPERLAAFDRWLAAHDAEVAATALREFADGMTARFAQNGDKPGDTIQTTPAFIADCAHLSADEYEMEAGL